MPTKDRSFYELEKSEQLRSKTISGLIWSFIGRFSQQGIQFITSIVLARLLLPEDFGLIAMIYIIIAMGHSFIDGGFQKALIQKKECSALDKSSVFYFNIGIAIVVASIIFVSAPLIAIFYERYELIPIVRFISVIFLFSSLGLVQDALFAKTLQFKQLFIINTLSSILASIISIIMAFMGFGVWSLVILNIGGTLFRTIFLWLFSAWRPSAIFSLHSLKTMFTFGSSLFFVSATNSIFTNIYQVLIGKIYSAESLGFYSRAKNLSMYPVTVVTGVVSQVTFPVFSKIQNDKKELTKYIKKSLTLLALITFPLMIGLIVVAKPLILILLTEKWLSSVHYFQLLCLVGMIYPLQVVNLNALNALGHSKKYLQIDIINKTLTVVFVLFTFRYGVSAMIIGQIVNTFIAYYLSTFHLGKIVKYPFNKQVVDLLPGFLASILMGIAIYSIHFIIVIEGFLLLGLQITTGITIYIVLCYLFSVPAFSEGIAIIKTYKYKHSIKS